MKDFDIPRQVEEQIPLKLLMDFSIHSKTNRHGLALVKFYTLLFGLEQKVDLFAL